MPIFSHDEIIRMSISVALLMLGAWFGRIKSPLISWATLGSAIIAMTFFLVLDAYRNLS